MDPHSLLQSSNGIARSSSLLRLGVSRHRLANALRTGSVMRPRRGWIALPGTDPELLAAATHGVVLSCITQARRLGLWVLHEERTHLASRTPNSHVDLPDCVVHWGAPLLPRGPDHLEDPLVNVLAYVAACQPIESAQTVWESALNQKLTTLEQLRRYPFVGAARELLRSCRPYADSGLESIFRSRLGWLGVRILAQIWLFGHRVDFLIGDRLVVQIDGSTHTGAQRDADNRHDAELLLLGYHIIRISYRQVVDEWPAVQQLIMDAVAQGLHVAK